MTPQGADHALCMVSCKVLGLIAGWKSLFCKMEVLSPLLILHYCLVWVHRSCVMSLGATAWWKILDFTPPFAPFPSQEGFDQQGKKGTFGKDLVPFGGQESWGRFQNLRRAGGINQNESYVFRWPLQQPLHNSQHRQLEASVGKSFFPL